MNGTKKVDIKKLLLRVGKYVTGSGLCLALIASSGYNAVAQAKEGEIKIGVASFAEDDKDKGIQKGLIAYLKADLEKSPEMKDSVAISPINTVITGSSRPEQEAFTLQTGVKEKISLVIWGKIAGEEFWPNVTWINAKSTESYQYGDVVSRPQETIVLPVQSLKKPTQLALLIGALTSLERGKKSDAAAQFDQLTNVISKNVSGDIYFYNAFAHYASFDLSNTSPLKKSVELFNNAMKGYQEEKNWARHADVQNNLGLIFRKLAASGVDPEKNLRLSIVAFQEAAAFMKKNGDNGYAAAQYGLGLTYQTLAMLGIEPEQNLNYSVSAFNEVAQIEKKGKNGVGYIYAQSSLGGSFRALAQWGVSPEKNLNLSIDALKEAGKIAKDEKNAPLLTAMVQKGIGMTYQGLAQWGIDPQTNLKSAIAALKDAASLEKKQENIGGYLEAQNNLGMSYQALAQWGNEPKQNLEQSVIAFQEAALSGKGGKDKSGYAAAQNSMGMTYFLLAQQGVQSEQNFHYSIAALMEAALIRKEQGNWKEYAMIQNNLGMAYRELANRSVDSEQNLKKSIDILKEVSGLWKEQKNGAAGYAMAQNNLGLSYQALSDRGISPEENKKNAEDAFHESREPRTLKK
jgi:tetratricopeptide (TPR) repeat protein